MTVLLLLAFLTMLLRHEAELPDPADLKTAAAAPRVTVLAVDGSLLTDAAGHAARFVPLDEIAPALVNAVLATEDRRFFAHHGLDLRGIGRAIIANAVEGSVVEGGSTITQQLAKNLFLTPRRNLARKLEEALLALTLEARLSKEQILELYLNKAYLGAGTYGVDAAARRYFGKPARDVGLAEAAMIAGLFKAPSALAPTRNLDGARDRATLVLDAMLADGRVTEPEALAARARPAKLALEIEGDLAGGFVDWVMDGLEASLGRPRSDLTVRTTLEPSRQRAARDELRTLLAQAGPAAQASAGAAVLLDPSGAVRAMVGGPDYRASRLNRVTETRRQPGSAFKPLLYLAALEQGYGPGSILEDAPIRIGRWTPENYDGRYRGPVTLAVALSQSLNTPAVRLARKLGVGRIVEVAHRLGIASVIRDVPSLALGTSEVTLLELTEAYVPFAAGGLQGRVHGVTEVVDREGRTLYRHAPDARRVTTVAAAATMQALLAEVVRSGTGRAAAIAGRTVAGKTGTTQGYRDAWFVGWSGPDILGVWLGNDDGRPMAKVTGGTLPARLWRSIMERVQPPLVEPPQIDSEAAGLVVSAPVRGLERATVAAPEDPGSARSGPLDWLGRLVDEVLTKAAP